MKKLHEKLHNIPHRFGMPKARKHCYIQCHSCFFYKKMSHEKLQHFWKCLFWRSAKFAQNQIFHIPKTACFSAWNRWILEKSLKFFSPPLDSRMVSSTIFCRLLRRIVPRLEIVGRNSFQTISKLRRTLTWSMGAGVHACRGGCAKC